MAPSIATLPGGQFSLTGGGGGGGGHGSKHKELLFVRLTDSALKSIEEFIRNAGKIGSTPTIQFLPGDEGKISIPGVGGAQPVTFRFSLASNADLEGPQGSFECLQQSGPQGKSLQALGPMSTRMRILANDDVYEATKHRMAVDAENLKNKCTRVIKPNQTDIGRKIKVKHQKSTTSRPPSNHSVHNGYSNSNGNSQSNGSNHNLGVSNGSSYTNGYNSNSSNNNSSYNTNHSSSNTNSSSYNSNNHSSSNNSNSYNGNNFNSYSNGNGLSSSYNGGIGTCNSMSGTTYNSNSSSDNINSNNKDNSSSSYMGSANSHVASNMDGTINGHSGQPKNQQGRTTSVTPDLLKRPIKERLIQLLALRPYKKPELYNRINSEGIKDKERSVIKTVLQQISSIKDNCYHLHRHLWNDVNEDWPFFSEEEKQILKRRKPQNLTPPLSSDSGHSPSPPPIKRAATPLSGGSGTPPIKKQRISHYKKPNPDHPSREGDSSPAALSNGYHSSTSTSGASSGERKNYSDEDTPAPLTPTKRENGYSLSFGTAKNFFQDKPNGYNTSPATEQFTSTKTPCSPISHSGKRRSPDMMRLSNERDVNGGGSHRNKSPDTTTEIAIASLEIRFPNRNYISDGEMPDIASQYCEITSSEQRKRYKAEFAAQYDEYRQLHARVEAVTRLFTKLEERLRGEQAGGHAHREIKHQIVAEYEKIQNDKTYKRDIQLLRYLHLKLAHIKRLVQDYDNLHGLNTSVASAPATLTALPY